MLCYILTRPPLLLSEYGLSVSASAFLPLTANTKPATAAKLFLPLTLPFTSIKQESNDKVWTSALLAVHRQHAMMAQVMLYLNQLQAMLRPLQGSWLPDKHFGTHLILRPG